MTGPVKSFRILTPANAPKPFVAGIVVRDGRIFEAAPIIRYMVGWDGRRTAAYCRKKGWTLEP